MAYTWPIHGPNAFLALPILATNEYLRLRIYESRSYTPTSFQRQRIPNVTRTFPSPLIRLSLDRTNPHFLLSASKYTTSQMSLEYESHSIAPRDPSVSPCTYKVNHTRTIFDLLTIRSTYRRTIYFHQSTDRLKFRRPRRMGRPCVLAMQARRPYYP